MLEALRNILLPPPSIVLGIAFLVPVIGWWQKNAEVVSVDQEISEITFEDTKETVVFGLNIPEHDPTELIAISRHTLFLEAREPWAVPDAKLSEPIAAEAIVQPTEVLPIKPVAPTVIKPDLTLIGMVTRQTEHSALLFDKDTQSQLWVVVGDTIKSWEVSSIAKGHVVLRAEDEEIVVTYNR